MQSIQYPERYRRDAVDSVPGAVATGSHLNMPQTSIQIAEEITRLLGEQSIESIYRDKILTGRTRQYEMKPPKKGAEVEIIHTLLGVELKVGNRRLLCPDLATARYLSVFARLGCETIAVPYDITNTSRLADELESSWYRMLLLIESMAEGRSARLRRMVERHLIATTRKSIAEAGSGPKYPAFAQPARRKPRR